jgi:hypothetical protein
MSQLDIDSEIAKLEQSILKSSPSPVNNDVSSISSSTSVSSSNNNSFFSSKMIKKIGLSFILSLLTIIGFKPVYLCKLEYDEKEGKCKASFLFLKSTIAVICLSVFYFLAITFLPRFF